MSTPRHESAITGRISSRPPSASPAKPTNSVSVAKHDSSASAKPAHQRRIRRAHCRRRDARDPASSQQSPSLIRCCATGSTERSARTAARPRPPRRTLQRPPRRHRQALAHPRGPLAGGGTTPLQGPGLVRSGTEGGPARAGACLPEVRRMGPVEAENCCGENSCCCRWWRELRGGEATGAACSEPRCGSGPGRCRVGGSGSPRRCCCWCSASWARRWRRDQPAR